jgi:hypothetical protein
MNKKQILRKIIREEIKKVITEGTRALVGVEAPNGKVTVFYTHYDGYPQHTGKMLKKHYSNSGIVKKLMALGKHGVSFLDKSIKGGPDHSFKDPKKGETIFYGRDRGENDRMTFSFRDREKADFDWGTEYMYIWNMKEKKWYYKSAHSNPRDWTELK